MAQDTTGGKPFLWTAKLAQRALSIALGPSYRIFPNAYFGGGEMDLAAISSSGYLTEFEIKISAADWKADQLKEKWLAIRAKDREVVKYFTYVVPQELADPIPEWVDPRFGVVALRKPFEKWPHGERERHGCGQAVWLRHPKRLGRGQPLTNTQVQELLLKIYYRYWRELGQLPVAELAQLEPWEIPDDLPHGEVQQVARTDVLSVKAPSCPYCGCHDLWEFNWVTRGTTPVTIYQVDCNTCGAKGPPARTLARAVEVYATRTPS